MRESNDPPGRFRRRKELGILNVATTHEDRRRASRRHPPYNAVAELPRRNRASGSAHPAEAERQRCTTRDSKRDARENGGTREWRRHARYQRDS
jgi:hypothetical protein